MRDLIQNTSTKGKLILAGSALGVVLVAVLILKLASAPSYTTLVSGIDPAQTSKITAALDEKGVKWQLENNGTAIAVDKSQTAQARVALAEQGLPQQGTAGWELFDKQKLGASNLQQQVTYQRALEGELARTIEQVQGVSSAQVNLVLPPEDNLFQDQSSTAKASVLLSTGGAGLEPGAVRGIAQLVASSVKGLKLDNVSITDASGQLLWPNGNSGDPGSSATLKQAAESRYDSQLGASLNTLLAQTIGPGKGEVQVRSDLNVDQTTRESLTYSKKGVPLKTHKETETLRGAGGGGGVAGTGSNIPTYSTGGAGGNSSYKHTVGDTQWGVDKTVERTKVAPGAVNKLHVAVLVDKTVPPAELQQLKTVLSSAAGLDPKRGDTIAISQVAFAKQPAPAKPGVVTSILGPLKYVGLGVALLAFLFFMARHLKRRESEALTGEPVWLRELEQPTPISQLEGGMRRMPEAPPMPDSPGREQMEQILAQEPERVAQQVRAWMNEE
ncbi:MAG: flagellar M-ring protein FliF [Thermoleophilaceae bacterium]|nr:flagellar M-ring protein FliF [Thermoleophilaceae bacterium]